MASKTKKDPLSRYFKDLDECDISSGDDSESEEKETSTEQVQNSSENTSAVEDTNLKTISSTKEEQVKETAAANKQTPKIQKLPSAHECLKTKTSPAFLRFGQPKEVDWDSRLKRSDGDAVIDFNPNAVPPPTSYEPVTDPGIKVVDEDGNRKKRVGDDLEDQNTTTKAYKVQKADEES